MNTQTTPNPSVVEHPDALKPWYKQVWPWILIALPGSAVIACIITIIIAVRSPVSMVEDDYYKEGLAVNQNMEKQRAAEAANIRATLSAKPRVGTFEVDLNNIDYATLADNPILLTLIHPADAQQDRETTLARNAAGSLSGTVIPLSTGNWKIKIEPQDQAWRLMGVMPITDNVPETISLEANPG